MTSAARWHTDAGVARAPSKRLAARLTTPALFCVPRSFHDLSRFNTFVVVFNFLTLFCYVTVQLFLGAREVFLIDAFDVDLSLPADNLTEEMELYPTFKDKLRSMNIAAYVLTAFVVIMVATCVACFCCMPCLCMAAF